MSAAADQFTAGTRVRVNHVAVSLVSGQVTGRVAVPEFTGTVVRYWRNGYFIVRDDVHGCTCAYPAAELAVIEPEWRERTFGAGDVVHWHGIAEFGEIAGPMSGAVVKALRGVDGTSYLIHRRLLSGETTTHVVHWCRLA
jgi:hypothetical protein